MSAAIRAVQACAKRRTYTRGAEGLLDADRNRHMRASDSPAGSGEKLAQTRRIGVGSTKSASAGHAQARANDCSAGKGGNWNAPFLRFLDKLDESRDGRQSTLSDTASSPVAGAVICENARLK